MALKILVVDDHTMFRQGLVALLKDHEGVELVAQASDGHEALRIAQEIKPDIVIMDVAMDEVNGMDATRMMREACPDVKVLGVSMHSDRHFVGGMLEAGACGYLKKSCAFEELHLAIQTVMEKGIYLSPSVAGVLVDEYVQRNAERSRPKLSANEREVLKLFAAGKSTKEIAAILQRSVKTIESNRRNLMAKLELHSMADLTKYAIRQGLTSIGN